MQTDTRYTDTPDYGQKGATSSYKDRGSYGRDGPTAPDEDLPPSTAPVNGGSGYRSFGDVHHIGNTADNDIYRVTPNIEYDEVFTEPSSMSRPYCSIVWLNRLILTTTQVAVNVIFSVLFGVILSFIWGIVFALANVYTVYFMQPLAKLTFVLFRPFAMIFRASVRSFLDPFYESFGLMFSRIRGSFSLKASGFLPIVARNECASIQEV
ncbi:caveolin-1-like isoform X1 [Asterias rubens]|uniref:caveolin-1-like isoform X1 n=1 Tax=Asterias rubens TaxID=7604 RepID=UPI00145512C1|nr:caveolin-1-like isoform X1 [Asterias rubens]